MKARGRALLLLAVALGGCSVPIASGLEETDANRVVVALEESGIAADKEADPGAEGHFRVVVVRDDAAGAAQVLKQENLPPPRDPGVLDALGESSLVPSRTAEHAKLVAGTAGDLERSLRAIDGVLSARVHLAVPVKEAFESEQKTSAATASVLLRFRGATPPITQKDVQNLVAGAVSGLDPDKVAVVMTPAPSALHPLERGLSRLGPVTVTRSSLTPLRWLVGGVTLVNLILIGLLLALWAKVRRTQAALEQARAPAPTAR
jgi:type III secretion protein J